MVLPISVTPGSGEQAVRFINFEDYPDFFGFLSYRSRARWEGSSQGPIQSPTLLSGGRFSDVEGVRGRCRG